MPPYRRRSCIRTAAMPVKRGREIERNSNASGNETFGLRTDANAIGRRKRFQGQQPRSFAERYRSLRFLDRQGVADMRDSQRIIHHAKDLRGFHRAIRVNPLELGADINLLLASPQSGYAVKQTAFLRAHGVITGYQIFNYSVTLHHSSRLSSKYTINATV